MTIKTELFLALKSLVSNRVYFGITPPTVTALPRITVQGVGGASINFLEGGSPGLHTPRVQVNCWAASDNEATALARQVETALRAYSSLQTTVLGEPIDTIETEVSPWLYGTMQDFSVCGTS
jgi:hypothetical protein